MYLCINRKCNYPLESDHIEAWAFPIDDIPSYSKVLSLEKKRKNPRNLSITKFCGSQSISFQNPKSQKSASLQNHKSQKNAALQNPKSERSTSLQNHNYQKSTSSQNPKSHNSVLPTSVSSHASMPSSIPSTASIDTSIPLPPCVSQPLSMLASIPIFSNKAAMMKQNLELPLSATPISLPNDYKPPSLNGNVGIPLPTFITLPSSDLYKTLNPNDISIQ